MVSIADITNEHFKSSFDVVGAANDAKFMHSQK